MYAFSFRCASSAAEVDRHVGVRAPGSARRLPAPRSARRTSAVGPRRLQDVHGRDGRAARRQHRVEHQRQSMSGSRRQLVVVRHRLERLVVAVQPQVPDLASGSSSSIASAMPSPARRIGTSPTSLGHLLAAASCQRRLHRAPAASARSAVASIEQQLRQAAAPGSGTPAAASATSRSGVSLCRSSGCPEMARRRAWGSSGVMASVVGGTMASRKAFTGREDYAQHTAQLVRVWFLDLGSARMNPNLNFGQGIPGIADGATGRHRRDSILAANHGQRNASARFVRLARRGRRRARTGMRAYLKWLQESSLGRDEATRGNNQETWEEVQVVSLALYTGQADVARAGTPALAGRDQQGVRTRREAAARARTHPVVGLQHLQPDSVPARG